MQLPSASAAVSSESGMLSPSESRSAKIEFDFNSIYKIRFGFNVPKFDLVSELNSACADVGWVEMRDRRQIPDLWVHRYSRQAARPIHF